MFFFLKYTGKKFFFFNVLRGEEGLIFVKESLFSIIVTKNLNWSTKIYGKGLVMLEKRYHPLKYLT
jgi:hypothetical protein